MACYNKLTPNCFSVTTSLTSNDKFFPPLDAIYWKDWVPVHILDGNKVNISNQVRQNTNYNLTDCQRENTYCTFCNR
jgi:hypothetical protein